jgi:hypothetical protein
VNQVSIIAALGSEFVQLVDIVVFGEKTERTPRADELSDSLSQRIDRRRNAGSC